jgi:hypothetical protein
MFAASEFVGYSCYIPFHSQMPRYFTGAISKYMNIPNAFINNSQTS